MLGAVRWLILVTLTGALSPVMLPAPLLAQETVAFPGKAEPGTIVVRTNERKLYYLVDRGRALLARMAALRCFPVAIMPLRLSRRIPPIKHIRRAS